MNRFSSLLKQNQPAGTLPPVAGSLARPGRSDQSDRSDLSDVLPPVAGASALPGRSDKSDVLPPGSGTLPPPPHGLRVARRTAFLRRAPGEFPQEERALRDEKVQFVREVYEYSRRAGVPEWKAAEYVAEECAGFFPRLAEGGKNGRSMLHYTNYRNWLTGTSLKPGLGRLADGSPDYGNADVLLRNYGCEKTLYGDPAFWESFKAHYLQPNQQKAAKIYRLLELKWRIEYPGMPIPALHQVREYIRNRWPKRFLAYMRKGENYYLQHYRNFVERDPGSIKPNEAWVADSQDCDFMIRVPAADGNGYEAIRPKICVIMDVKSQHVISIQLVSRNDNGKVAVTNEVIRNAFALGVWRYGRPRIFLTDNGSDYCKAGFTIPVTFTPTVSKTKIYSHSIMLSLDVMHLTAEKYNARAKFVERFFREMAEYSRAARGYVGNAPENRPATAKVWAKEQNREYLMNEEQACEFLGTFIQLYHSKTCPDSKFLRGLSPEQAFAPELRFQRPAMTFEEYFRAFLLPLDEARIVESRGPSVRVGNRRFVAVPAGREKCWRYDGKPVMVKTDLVNDDHVFLFDLDGSYICEARTETMLPYFTRLTCEEDARLLAEKLEEIRAEKKFLDTLAMDETGNWHKLDPWTLYQLPREAFLGPARLKLLDSMYSVKGETHNPKIYVLPSELRSGDITGESRPARGAVPSRQAVKKTDGLHMQQCHDSTKTPARDRERKRQLDEAIRRALLKDAPAEETRERRSAAALDEIDQIPDEPKERKGVLDEEFI